MAKKQGQANSRPQRERKPRKARTVQFPAGTIADAVTERGLMDVEVMEALGVSSSTWFRWKRQDRVPVSQLYNVATLLGLPEPVTDDEVPRTPWFVMRSLEMMDARIARLEQHLLKAEPARRSSRSS